MHIGLAYDLRPDSLPAGGPDDAHEEFDSEAEVDDDDEGRSSNKPYGLVPHMDPNDIRTVVQAHAGGVDEVLRGLAQAAGVGRR